MMTLTRVVFAGSLTAFFAAAAISALAQTSPAPAPAATTPMATAPAAPAGPAPKPAVVNGHEISGSLVEMMVHQRLQQGAPDTPELRSSVREELIKRELVIQDAEKKGWAQNPEVTQQLDYARQQIILTAYIQDYFQKHPVSDADVKAEYDRLSKANNQNEYKASHILVKTESQAKDIIAKLKKGGNFTELAKQSEDPGSKDHGGDLGWNSPSTFVKPFSDAMVKLKKGEMTQEPVQTQFGYHVIRLDDTRPSKMPPMDQLSPRIKQQLQQAQLEKLVSDLRAKSTVQ
jgi:peptidyl-prolyl cis-trans isomerase C